VGQLEKPNLIEKNLKIRNLQGDSSSFSGKGCEKMAESNRFQGNEASEQVKARSPGNLQRIQHLASGNTVTADARNCSQWSFIELNIMCYGTWPIYR
jgi:hypothetical protein